MAWVAVPSGPSWKSCPDGSGPVLGVEDRLAGVGPLERGRRLVARLDVGEHLLGKILRGVEMAVLEQLSAENPEQALDLVEPAGVVGGEHEPPVRMRAQPRLGSDRGCCRSWRSSHASHRCAPAAPRTGSSCRCACTHNHAERACACPAQAACQVGRPLAWTLVFSSIESTSALRGGSRYRPHTSLQRSSKYG